MLSHSPPQQVPSSQKTFLYGKACEDVYLSRAGDQDVKSRKQNCPSLKCLVTICGMLGVCSLPAYADPYVNTFDNQDICNSLQFAVHKLSPNTSSTDWPKRLNAPSVAFLSWNDTDPKRAVDLIEESYLEKVVEDRNFAIRLQVGGNGLQQYKQSDLNIISKRWVDLVKPTFDKALENGSLEFQTSNIQMDWDQGKELVAFRYRIKMTNHPHLGDAHVLLDASYNWQYVLRIRVSNSSFRDYPISRGLSPLAGELAVLKQTLVLFVTNSSVGPDLLEVYLPPVPSWWPYGGLAVSDACPLSFSK